jgi:hypothetical protein
MSLYDDIFKDGKLPAEEIVSHQSSPFCNSNNLIYYRWYEPDGKRLGMMYPTLNTRVIHGGRREQERRSRRQGRRHKDTGLYYPLRRRMEDAWLGFGRRAENRDRRQNIRRVTNR